MRILVTGAAGNLGSHVSRHLLASGHELRLLIHEKPLPADMASASNVECCRADLGNVAGLDAICRNVDCIVHLAGVLFAPRPSEFLPKTNVGFVENLVQAALQVGVRKFLLLSFPHVEGETNPEHPATNRLETNSDVIHFRTRLEAERRLLNLTKGTQLVPVVIRAGVVYGHGIKLIEAARTLLRYRILAVWKAPTWVHLISLPDLLRAIQAAIDNPGSSGIYNVCDDAPLTIQEFLDRLAAHWNYPRPWRLPTWILLASAAACEALAALLRTPSPLTRDIIKAGMTSSVADNQRMKRELLPVLAFPTLGQGLTLL